MSLSPQRGLTKIAQLIHVSENVYNIVQKAAIACNNHLHLSQSYNVSKSGAVKWSYDNGLHGSFCAKQDLGAYSPTILKNILCLFLQEFVNLKVTHLLIG